MPSTHPKKILVAYSMQSTFTTTTLEYLLALKNYTDYDVSYVHVTNDARINFDMNDYDVVFHNYCARLCFEGYVSESYKRALKKFIGLKIIAVQDDYDRTATLHNAIRDLGFHVLLTCIQPDYCDLAYPASELPGVKRIHGLTGYMPERLAKSLPPIMPLAEREIAIGYRGRDIGAKYGRLGFDKYEIGRRMAEICDARGLSHNIAMDDSSRIYGDAWFEFLGSSRTMLGSESASNAFDFDGDLERQIAAFTQEHGRAPGYQEFRHVLDPLEAPFNVGQISPRVFECALMRTPMILFRGRYSDAMEPDVHYIALEKDFSNADAILDRLDDLDYLQGFADRAYERLVASGNYGYSSLAKLLSGAIQEQYPVRVDPKWVNYRRTTSQPWPLVDVTAQPETEEEARAIAYAEVATDMPLTMDDLHKKNDQFVQIANRISFLKHSNNMLIIDDIEFNENTANSLNKIIKSLGAYKIHNFVRFFWRLLPISIRQHIIALISRRANRNN